MDLNFVPKDNNELYSHYFKKVAGRSIVGTILKGIVKYASEEEMATLSNDVFLRMLDKNVLGNFDPSKGNFGGAVFFVTRSVAVNYLERKERDPLGGLYAGSLVETSEDDEFEPGVYRLESRVGSQDLEREAVAKDSVSQLTSYLETLASKATNKRDANLIKVVRLLAEESTPQEISEELKVTKATVLNWMGRLAEIAKQLHLS